MKQIGEIYTYKLFFMDEHFVPQEDVMAQSAICVKVYILIEKIK
jgi:hypothetical protein